MQQHMRTDRDHDFTARMPARRSDGARAPIAALVALLLLLNVLSTAMGLTCRRGGQGFPRMAAQAAHVLAVVVPVHDRSPSSGEHSLPAVQSCGPVLAMPARRDSMTPASLVADTPRSWVRELVASHDPPPPFRPPRVI